MITSQALPNIHKSTTDSPVTLHKPSRGARTVELFAAYEDIYWAAIYDLFRYDLGVEDYKDYPPKQVLSIVETSFTLEERIHRFQKFCY